MRYLSGISLPAHSRHPRNAPLAPLQRYLEGIPGHCPHELFLKETPRASRTKSAFPAHVLRLTVRRDNLSVESLHFALQVVENHKHHPTVQEFLLVNDTATVAVEVPIALTAADLAHYV